jgi:capsular polysaccharide biosynthesis protein
MRMFDGYREHVVDVLKAAFVQGRLTKDEFDQRMGQALGSRIFAELTATTADLPAGLLTAQQRRSTAQVGGRPPASTVITASACVVFAAAMLGLLLGIAFALLSPAVFRSTAIVVLPSDTRGMATQAVIAGSSPVLAGALHNLPPHVPQRTLIDRVQATVVSADALSISAEGRTAEQAAGTANAVASSYVAYVTGAQLPGGPPRARITEPARGATAAPLPPRLPGPGLGAIYGVLIGAAGALAFTSVWPRVSATAGPRTAT